MNSVTDKFPKPVVLVRDETYYLAGDGVFEHKGLMAKKNLPPHEAKKFSSAKEVYRFKPDPVYANTTRTEHYIADHVYKRGVKIYDLPTLAEIGAVLQILREPAQPAMENQELKYASGNLQALAEVIRDSKKPTGNPIVTQTRTALACLMGFHMKSSVKEAEDYIGAVVTMKDWPRELPLLPVSRDAMIRISAAYAARHPFTPEFTEALVTPLLPEPVPPPQSVIAVSQVSVEAPLATPAPVPHAPTVIKRDRVKAFNPCQYDRAVPFARDGKLYTQIAAELVGQTGMMALVDAAVDTGMIQKDVMYLTRAIFTKEKLSMTNVVRAKNLEKTADEHDWDVDQARQYYHEMIDALLKAVPENLSVEAEAAATVLYSHIDITQRKSRHTAVSTTAAPVGATREAVAPVTTAPAVVAATAAEAEPVDVEVVGTSIVVTLTDVPLPTGEANYNDADRIVGQFAVAVHRRREEPISPLVSRELKLAVTTLQDAPMALLAADRLSPIAFEIFSGVALRKKDMGDVARDLGTDEYTIRKIFIQAAHVVREAVSEMQRSAPVRPSLDGFSHNVIN